MSTHLRYTTFSPGQFEAEARRRMPRLPALAEGGTSAALAFPTSPVSPRGRLLKAHTCAVTYPDGTEGTCAYERGGPTWHLFKFRDHEGDLLPVQYWNKPLGNTTGAIKVKAWEMADAAYRSAVERERKEHFQRASESAARRKRPERYRMSGQRAREQSGRYSVCLRLRSGSLIPTGESFAASWGGLMQANAACLEAMDRRSEKDSETDQDLLVPLVVGCCNRLDRCWQLPRYNPLYEEYDPPTESDGNNDGNSNAWRGGGAMTAVSVTTDTTDATAISLEEARHQANAFRKADFLYERGYRAEWLTEDVLEMRNPRGRSYLVDTFNHECCCDGYILHGFCSHLWGWPKLLHDQQWQERYGNDNANG